MSSPAPRRRRRIVAVAAGLVVLAVAGIGALLAFGKPGDVSHPSVEFTTPATTATQTPPPQQAQPKKPVVKQDTFLWPTYGFTDARTRAFTDAPRNMRPPFKRGWTYRGTALLEFPPAIDGPMLYVLDDNGDLVAITKTTGHVRWRRKLGRLAASSPAVGDGNVYAVALTGLSGAGGRVASFAPKNGHINWSRDLPSRAESSPLLKNGSLYFGSEDGTVYSLDAKSGRIRWTYKAGGAVKGGPAYANGILYFGDYSGHVHAVNATSGKEVWSVGTNGAKFGLGSGTFYATPTVAFGRVYLGNTDGRVYSFAAHSGKLAWATSTGAYVYSSAAVADTPGLGPTLYVGSYDGNFYAFDAQSGAVRWKHAAGGKISGGATIVGNVVYFSNLAAKNTIGLDVRTGHRVFGWTDGSFNPVVADTRAVYLTGYAALYELLPTSK
ncbi:MAG: Pyrrolo-quinoline quinone [Conexibacter sp.]|nr:Pyrrolo-quinoline quinone [Conexibacter sp.]